MTLILGIKCSDGIVLGADGAATFGSLGQSTIRQPVRKLTVLAGCVVAGVSGPIGMSQRICGEIENLWIAQAFKGKKPFQAMTTISETIRPHIVSELQIAATARQVLGPVAVNSALTATVVALPISKSLSLFQFDQQGSPEEATNDLPFVAVGSGQPIADPFLAFLRRVFWPNRAPKLSEGEFAAVWCLEHAIQTHPGGVADPKQIVILEKSGSDFAARELGDPELQEHLEAIAAAERRLATFMEEPKVEISEPPPEPPGA